MLVLLRPTRLGRFACLLAVLNPSGWIQEALPQGCRSHPGSSEIMGQSSHRKSRFRKSVGGEPELREVPSRKCGLRSSGERKALGTREVHLMQTDSRESLATRSGSLGSFLKSPKDQKFSFNSSGLRTR